MQRVLVGLCVVLVLLVAVGWWWQRMASTGAVLAIPTISKDQVTAKRLSAPSPPASTAEPGHASPPASAVSGPMADGDPDAKVWDLCGIGRLPIPQALLALATGRWTELPKHLGDTAQALGRERLQQALSQGDARARAAGLLLSHSYAQRDAWQTMATQNQRELTAESDAQLAKAATTQQALLALAQSSQDPVIASWALASCGFMWPCRTQAAALWRQLDPSNAAALLVGPSQSPADQMPVIDAIAQSARFSSHFGSVAGTALAAMPADVPPYVQQLLLVDVIGLESVHVHLSGLAGLIPHCSPAPPPGSRQHATCQALARLLTERSDTLISQRIGFRLGELAGWPKAQVNEQMQKFNELSAQAVLLAESGPYSCAAVEKSRAWVREVAAKGELAALRALATEKFGNAAAPK